MEIHQNKKTRSKIHWRKGKCSGNTSEYDTHPEIHQREKGTSSGNTSKRKDTFRNTSDI